MCLPISTSIPDNFLTNKEIVHTHTYIYIYIKQFELDFIIRHDVKCVFTAVNVVGNTWEDRLVFLYLFYLFGVLCRFQHCTGHITTGSWKGRGNQYIQFARVVYCKLPTNGKQLPAFPLKAVTGIEPRPQGLEVFL